MEHSDVVDRAAREDSKGSKEEEEDREEEGQEEEELQAEEDVREKEEGDEREGKQASDDVDADQGMDEESDPAVDDEDLSDGLGGRSLLGVEGVSGTMLLNTTSRVIDTELERVQQTQRDIALADATLQKISKLNHGVQKYANDLLMQESPGSATNLASAQALVTTQGSMRKGFDAVRYLYKKIRKDQIRALRSEVDAQKVFKKWARIEPEVSGGL